MSLTSIATGNNIVLHVVGAACDLSRAELIEPRFGKFSNDSTYLCPRMSRAAKPENFTKAGFFFCACRTPHDSKRQCPGLRGTKQGALYEGRRSRSVCEEPTRTSKWFDKGLAHHTGARKMNRIATRNVVLWDGVKAGSNLLALPIS